LGKFTNINDVVAGGNGDYFLYSGANDSVRNLYKGNFYVYQNGTWVNKKQTTVQEMDIVLDDMLSLVDTSDTSASVVSIVNRLVASEVFVDKLIANEGFIKSLTSDTGFIGKLTSNEAFINKLTSDTALITNIMATSLVVKNEIKSDSYVAGSTGFKINKNGDVEFNAGRFRSKLGNSFTYTTPFYPNGNSSIMIVNAVYYNGHTIEGAFVVSVSEQTEMSAGKVDSFTIIELYRNSNLTYSKERVASYLNKKDLLKFVLSNSGNPDLEITELIIG